MNSILKRLTDPDPFITELIRRDIPFECEIACEKCGTLIWAFCSCELYKNREKTCYHWCEPCFNEYINQL